MQKRRAHSMDELRQIQGKTFDPEKVAEGIKAYQPQPTDIVITPFGKSGTTWTQQIFHTLRTRGDMDFDDISRVVPWIETSARLGIDINAPQRAAPRGFKSHLGFAEIPKGARYINVIRHPVDAAYSAFKFMEGWYLEPGAVSADEFVRAGLQDRRYYKHFVGWWQHRQDNNVLYLVYEHMKKDLPGTIEKIAAFSDITLDDELLAITLEHASLPFMQSHKDRFDDAMLRKLSEEESLPAGSDSAKVRAGKVGVHELSERLVREFDQIWVEDITPATGFDSYESLIASLE